MRTSNHDVVALGGPGDHVIKILEMNPPTAPSSKKGLSDAFARASAPVPASSSFVHSTHSTHSTTIEPTTIASPKKVSPLDNVTVDGNGSGCTVECSGIQRSTVEYSGSTVEVQRTQRYSVYKGDEPS